MQRFLADWRNSALIVLAVLALIFLVMAYGGGTQRNNTPLVRIGDRTVTNGEFLDRLKRRKGDEELLSYVNQLLIEDYARQKGVAVETADIRQIVSYYAERAEIENVAPDYYLNAMGVDTSSKEDLASDVGAIVLQVKLTIPDADLQAAIKQVAANNQYPMTLPPYLKYREFIFDSADKAKTEIALLEMSDVSDKTIADVAANAVNSSNAADEHLYVPVNGFPGANLDSDTVTALKSLSPGKCSPPLPLSEKLISSLSEMASDQDLKGFTRVLQLVDAAPEEKPTMDNRSFVLGQQMLNQEKWAAKSQEMLATALNTIPVDFVSSDYKAAAQHYDDLKKQLPNITPAGPTAPR